MAGHVPTGPVVIFDDDHYYIGGLLAEKLRSAGCDVTLVTPSGDVSSFTHNTLEQARIQRRLIEMDVKILPLHYIVHLGATSVTVACNFTDRSHVIACGSFVPVTMRRPIDTLFHEVKALVGKAGSAQPSLTRIGDCYAPGTIAAAVYAGHRYARELGEPASDAVPFKRELPALAPY